MSTSKISIISRELREDVCPFFSSGDIEYYLNKNNGDVEDTLYEMLLIKAEDSTISVSGLQTSDTSSYFRKLASRHKKFNTGILGGG